MTEVEADLRLQLPGNIQIIGQTQSGKSHLLFKELLCHTTFAQRLGLVCIHYSVADPLHHITGACLKKRQILVAEVTRL